MNVCRFQWTCSRRVRPRPNPDKAGPEIKHNRQGKLVVILYTATDEASAPTMAKIHGVTALELSMASPPVFLLSVGDALPKPIGKALLDKAVKVGSKRPGYDLASVLTAGRGEGRGTAQVASLVWPQWTTHHVRAASFCPRVVSQPKWTRAHRWTGRQRGSAARRGAHQRAIARRARLGYG